MEKGYRLTEVQAQAILDMRLQKLTGLEQDKIIKEYEEIIERIIDLLENEEARQTLTSHALKQAQKFSWALTAEKTAAIIKSVLPDRAGAVETANRAVS